MPNLVESRYRDYLAKHLDLIERGLTLIEAEMSLPNLQGARGFVDLVARDRFGVLVLVEIKRSDSAARSAMHELFKYMALFRQNHGLDKHQVRCMLLSTTWHELLVPFSELLHSAPFEVTGRELLIGVDGKPSETREVTPLDSVGAITICPKHNVLLYRTPDSRLRDVERVAATMSDAGVEDYFLIHLDHDGSNPHVVTPYSLYVVLGELSSGQRETIQRERDQRWRDDDVDVESEPTDLAHDDDDEAMDASRWDHEEEVFVWLNAAAGTAAVEIGNHDKLRQVLDSWDVVAFTRSGRFTSTMIWPDEALVAGAVAEGGRHTTVFTSQVSTANDTAYSRMLKNVDYSLMGAKGWRKQIPRLLQHLRSDTLTTSISIHLFSPCDLLWGLAALAVGKIGYLPAFELVAESEEVGPRIFVGALEWDGETRISPETSMDDIVDGGPMRYHISRHFGSQWEEEEEYCKCHGLHYEIYEFTSEGADRKFWRVHLNKSNEMRRTAITWTDLRACSIHAFAEANLPYLERLSQDLVKGYALGSPF